MFKNLLFTLLILLIAGCSTKKMQDRAPFWYTNPPSDYKFIYSTAASKTPQSARNVAVLSINTTLNTKVTDALNSTTSPLHVRSEKERQELAQSSSKIVNKIVFHGIQTINTARFHSEQLILIRVSRDMIFQEQKSKLDALYIPIKKKFEAPQTLTPLQEYATLKPLYSRLNDIAVLAQLLTIITPGYDSNEYFAFVNQLRKRTDDLKSSIALRILGDLNSLGLVKPVEEALSKEGLYLTRKLDREENYNIFLTTNAQKQMDYQFYKVTLTLKSIIATQDKHIISTKMHTFIGKSRKSYADAKLQAESGLNSAIKLSGIFDFFGLNSP